MRSTGKLPFHTKSLPDGWFSKAKIFALYETCLKTDGPFLEIGSWVGRSTCVICYALQQRQDHISFTTVDYGISSPTEWKSFFGDSVFDKPDPKRYLRHINQYGGTISSLRRNLATRGLLGYAKIRKADFHALNLNNEYGLIFCDATHDKTEIDNNVPEAIRLLRNSGTLILDDIDDELCAHLLDNFKFCNVSRHEKLFIGKPA